MANNVEITKDILREAIKAQERLLNYWDKDKDTKQYYEVVGKKEAFEIALMCLEDRTMQLAFAKVYNVDGFNGGKE